MATSTALASATPPAMIEAEDLRARWRALVGDRAGAVWWEEVAREYGGPSRHYHALSHLRQMFKEADQHSFKRPDVVALAIFFHDLIYNPKSGTNEEDSAGRFMAFAQEAGAWLTEADAARVEAYILATKSHACKEDEEGEEDLRLFLDIDMSVLGQPCDAYLRYAGQIRKEYAHVPRPTYLTARVNVLTSFLGRERVYVSDFYRARLEERARANVAAEIESLKAGRIPGEEDKEPEHVEAVA